MPGSGPARAGAIAILVLAGLLVSGAVSFVSAGAAQPSPASQVLPTAADPTWSNGLLKVNFIGAGPAFTVLSASDSRIGIGQTLSGLAEVNTTGHLVALAAFNAPGIAWSFLPQQAANGITVTMTADLNVTRASGYWEGGDDSSEDGSGHLGATHATVVFYLNASSSSTAWTVAYTLNVTGWPWSHRSDSLGIQVNSTTLQSSAMWTPSTNNSIRDVSASTTIATYLWGAGATVHYTNGTASLSAVESDRNQSEWGNESFVRLDFGAVSGGYTSLEYDPWITLNPSAFKLPAWVFTPATLETSGGALALVAVLAAVATVRRRKVSRPDL